MEPPTEAQSSSSGAVGPTRPSRERLTLAEWYALQTRCSPVAFRFRLFWQTLYPQAKFVAPFLGGIRSKYFAPERELLDAVGRVKTQRQLAEEIRDYFSHPWNVGWWRKVARIRISTHRLRRVTRLYFGSDATSGGGSPP